MFFLRKKTKKFIIEKFYRNRKKIDFFWKIKKRRFYPKLWPLNKNRILNKLCSTQIFIFERNRFLI